MSLSRRQFLQTAAAVAAAWPARARALAGWESRPFVHGIASGDPLADGVILWTRVTPSADHVTGTPVRVRWHVATDEGLTQVVARGEVNTSADRDYTVKVDARGLKPGRTYFYAFETEGERSSVGRTKTLSERGLDRLRLAIVCCANFPAGFFNVYRCVADREDLDAVLHLGDYIYEFPNGVFGDGAPLDRLPEPAAETRTLADYRLRYATYRRDQDLQAAHQRHPFIAVWDDHELADNAWRGGAARHDPVSEGPWSLRRAAAYRAYMEWMPIRESRADDIRLYRSFAFGGLADLVMLDTRGLRDAQVAPTDATGLADPGRTLLGLPQEAWLQAQLRASQRAGSSWRLLGQQILFSPMTPPGIPIQNTDVWEGYPAARQRMFDVLAGDAITNVAILSGDIHSSWAFDVARDPWKAYDRSTGRGSTAVEIVAPAISSPPLFTEKAIKAEAPMIRALLPHLKFLEGDSNGYTLVDISRQRLIAEWYLVPSVRVRATLQSRAAAFACERDSARFVPA